MGVDAKAYIGMDVTPEIIVYALARAYGVTPPAKDKPNPFDSRVFIRGYDWSPASFWSIEIPGAPNCSLHLAQDCAPFGPTWLLSGRASAERIAAFEAVCRTFGGMLVWSDSSDEGQWWQSPERRDFTAFTEAAYAVTKAPVTERHQSKAAYR